MANYRKFSLTKETKKTHTHSKIRVDALGYKHEDPPAPHTSWEEAWEAWGMPEERRNDFNAIVDPDGIGPRIFIQKVPEPKTSKNRLHLDILVSESPDAKDHALLQAKADELVALGATLMHVFDDPDEGHWIVMADPEGNEYCLI